VIASFGDDETELFAAGMTSPQYRHIAAVADRRLRQLDAAVRLSDLANPPGNRLRKLKGRWAGYYSIRVNDQYRLVFRWHAGDAFDVTLVDYH